MKQPKLNKYFCPFNKNKKQFFGNPQAEGHGKIDARNFFERSRPEQAYPSMN